MRVPISFALTYPDRAATPVAPLDLASGLVLEFEAPDLETFPLLRLARVAGERGGTAPCAFNAANEVAVAAFLDSRIPFTTIAEAVEETLTARDWEPASDLAELVEADAEARTLAGRVAVAAEASLAMPLQEAGRFTRTAAHPGSDERVPVDRGSAGR
jgi:1-deoxy-D-xylulose-5-phosphate reductoisomerase